MHSIPDSSIVGIKPIFSDLPIEPQVRKNKSEGLKRCCICGAAPTKMAKYPIQGAVRIERYCDRCAQREFARP
jgi:hypothetical protein